jgi:hypothetical protein
MRMSRVSDTEQRKYVRMKGQKHANLSNISYCRKHSIIDQCCPTFLYTGAHQTDGCGGAGALWRLQ